MQGGQETSGPRRQYTKEFKLQGLREIEAGKSIAQASREYEISSSLIGNWKRLLKDNPRDAFSGSGNAYKLEAKIAEMAWLIGHNCDVRKSSVLIYPHELHSASPSYFFLLSYHFLEIFRERDHRPSICDSNDKLDRNANNFHVFILFLYNNMALESDSNYSINEKSKGGGLAICCARLKE